MSFSICIVIPTHDRVDLLRRTLESLRECERPASPIITYLAENGSRSGAEYLVSDAPAWLNLRYIWSERPNKSEILNQLLTKIENELVIFFDDDIRLARDTLAAYEQAASNRGTSAFFGGPMGVDYELSPPDWLTEFLPPSAKGLDSDQIDIKGPFPFLGCNWAAWASDLRECGGFDAAIGPGGVSGAVGQETDMQRRLTRAGITPVLVPAAQVWHYVPQDRCSPDWALKRAYRNGVSAGLGKRPGPSWLMGVPPWMIRTFVKRAIILAASRCSPDQVTRFRASSDFAYFRGRMHGARLTFTGQGDAKQHSPNQHSAGTTIGGQHEKSSP